jgi:Putative Ig domain
VELKTATKRRWRTLGIGAAGFALAWALAGCGGGGGSSTTPPPTNNLVPSINSISPDNAPAGSGSFTLTVGGTNFISASMVQWNGAGRTTTFVSSSQLTASISSSDIATPGTAQVTVFTPSPGGGTSNVVAFAISTPIPAISSVSPSNAVAGQPGLTLTVFGANFESNAVLRWNGSDRSTTVQSATQLTALITAGDVASAGTASLVVANPGPPEADSSAVSFFVLAAQPLALTTTSLPPSADNKSYHFVLDGSGGVPPLTWTISSGALPSGLSLDSSSGLISGTITGTTSSFTAQVTDFKSNSASQPLSIAVLSSLGRNDQVCTTPGSPPSGPDQATPISNGTLRASISPYGDVDTYTFTLNQTATNLTIETFAQQLDIGNNLTVRSDFLDTVLELLDANCNLVALNDDIYIPTGSTGTHIQDSKIVVGPTPFPQVPVPCSPATSTISCTDTSAPTSLAAGTYYIRVRDYRGDGRPDLLYDLQVSGIP